MSRRMFRMFPLLVVAALLLLPTLASGQQFRANLTGTVTDAQGAVVPGVTVTVLNTETSVAAEDGDERTRRLQRAAAAAGTLQDYRRALGLQDLRA